MGRIKGAKHSSVGKVRVSFSSKAFDRMVGGLDKLANEFRSNQGAVSKIVVDEAEDKAFQAERALKAHAASHYNGPIDIGSIQVNVRPTKSGRSVIVEATGDKLAFVEYGTGTRHEEYMQRFAAYNPQLPAGFGGHGSMSSASRSNGVVDGSRLSLANSPNNPFGPGSGLDTWVYSGSDIRDPSTAQPMKRARRARPHKLSSKDLGTQGKLWSDTKDMLSQYQKEAQDEFSMDKENSWDPGYYWRDPDSQWRSSTGETYDSRGRPHWTIKTKDGRDLDIYQQHFGYGGTGGLRKYVEGEAKRTRSEESVAANMSGYKEYNRYAFMVRGSITGYTDRNPPVTITIGNEGAGAIARARANIAETIDDRLRTEVIGQENYLKLFGGK